MFKNPINTAFETLINNLNEPVWLTSKRQQAFKKFQELGVPSRKSELWKYTDIKRLEATKVDISKKQKVYSGDAIHIEVNHHGFKIHSKLPECLSIYNLSETEEAGWQQLSSDQDRAFVELNMAMLNTGLQIDVAKNARVKLHIHYLQSNNDWNNVRTILNLDEKADVELNETYDFNSLINHVSIINLGDYTKLKQEVSKSISSESSLIQYTKINCSQQVTLEQSNLNKNGLLAHTIQDVDFNAENSNLNIASANLSENSNHIAEHIHVNHIVGNCVSKVIKRSIAKDKSQISVNAKAIVFRGADGSDISQSLKNILMSDDAKIYSKPELEINTDDVVAAHGSTIGELDHLSLSYLRSRGITYQEAQNLLIESFLQDANIFKKENFIETIGL